jgi:hypothetical protein
MSPFDVSRIDSLDGRLDATDQDSCLGGDIRGVFVEPGCCNRPDAIIVR